MSAPGDRTYTTAKLVLDAWLRAVRTAMPELRAVIRGYQPHADAAPPDEPYASIALAPIAPEAMPEVTYPWEDGTATDTAAPYAIQQLATVRRLGVVAVTIIGPDSLDLAELLDARLTGEIPTNILRDAGADYAPMGLDDATELDGDAWTPIFSRTFAVAYWRQDALRAKAIDTATITEPTVSQET